MFLLLVSPGIAGAYGYLFSTKEGHYTFSAFAFVGAEITILGIINGLKAGLCVRSDETFVVTENGSVWHLGKNVVWHHGNLSTSTGCINHKGGYAKAGGMPPQGLDDLDTFGDGGAKMGDSFGEVALVDVIGTHPVLDQSVD